MGGPLSGHARQAKKWKLFRLQNGRCYYCHNAFVFSNFTFDHVIRKKDGGTNSIHNLVLACAFCNQYRELDGASSEAKQRFIRNHTRDMDATFVYPIVWKRDPK